MVGENPQRKKEIMKFVIRIFTLSLITVFAISATARQTIFNVPSTDVLDKGKVCGL